MSQPLATQAASQPACLPEQSIMIGARSPPARRYSSASVSSSGRSAGVRSALSSSPAEARIRRTPSRWKASAEWLEAASASSSPSTASPARRVATAWNGLAQERGNTGASGAPRAYSTEPSAASSTREP